MRKIAEVLNKYKNKEFEWGKYDCCLFASDCVKARVGIDPAEKYRGMYDSELSAKKLLVKLGTIEETYDSLFDRIDIKVARRGDVVLYDSGMGQTLGVVWLGGVLAMGYHTYGIVENVDPIAVWRIA